MDYSIQWPGPSEEQFSITYTPDLSKDLSDPRLRVVTVSRQSEVLDVSDDYPLWLNLVYVAALLGVGAVLGGLVYIGTRPDIGIDKLHGRITAKKAESEYEAAKFMSRLQ